MGAIEESIKNIEKGGKNKDEVFSWEVFSEILSWLPLNYLLQLQLVSKEWQAMIYGRYLMEKHMARQTLVWHMLNRPIPNSYCFFFCDCCDGLLLVRNVVSLKYFIWNPFIGRALELPDTHNESCYAPTLFFVPSTANHRIVSIYKDKEFGKLGCQVITPGPFMCWRSFDIPNANANANAKDVLVVSTGRCVHCIRYTANTRTLDGADIITLDVATECFTLNHLPKGLLYGCWQVCAIDWDGKLAFVGIIGVNLHVVVLEDYMKQRWSEKKIIPLPLIKSSSPVSPFSKKQGEIFFSTDTSIVSYTIKTGQISDSMETQKYFFSSKSYPCKPSLVSIKGMQPDTHFEEMRSNLRLDSL